MNKKQKNDQLDKIREELRLMATDLDEYPDGNTLFGEKHVSLEKMHQDADRLICDGLRIAGLGDIADLFEEAKYVQGFWYA